MSNYDIYSGNEIILNERVRNSRLFTIHKLYFEDLENLIKNELDLLNSETYNLMTSKETSDDVKSYINLIELNFKLMVKTYNLPYNIDDDEKDEVEEFDDDTPF